MISIAAAASCSLRPSLSGLLANSGKGTRERTSLKRSYLRDRRRYRFGRVSNGTARVGPNIGFALIGLGANLVLPQGFTPAAGLDEQPYNPAMRILVETTHASRRHRAGVELSPKQHRHRRLVYA